MEIVYKATNIIERDSLMVFFQSHGIEAITGRRDVIQNLTDQPNLSYEGYSALFSGYEIFVQGAQLSEAKELLAQYKRQMQLRSVEPDEEHFHQQKQIERRMMTTAILSLFLPVIAHIIFIYLLFRGLLTGNRFSKWFLIRVIIILISTAVLAAGIFSELNI